MLTYAASNGEISPTQLYLLLVQVAGQLATFSPDVDPSKLPIFQHTDLRATFEELFARVTYLLRNTVRETYLTVPLEFVGGSARRARSTTSATCARRTTCSRSARTSRPICWRSACRGCARSRRARSCPASSASAATPGVPIQVTHRPPQEIPIRAGVTYFTLGAQSEYWRQIQEERTVAIYLPPPLGPDQVKIELLVVPRRADRATTKG